MNLKIIPLLALILALSSCESNSNQVVIELNNGEKWEVNVEMLPPIQASEKLVSEFDAIDIKAYIVLAEKLKENNKVLISSCTMEGKSHDELHKWLYPYLALVEELATAKEESKAAQILLKIEHSFETYNQHFQ